jgi:hypothetical protein
MKITELIEAQTLNFEEYISKLPKEIVEKLRRSKQNPKWHPEGSVYNHLKIVFDKIKSRGKDWAIAAIFHDLGKLDTESENETGVHHYGHDKESMKYLDKYLHLFPFENKEFIYELVKEHMRIAKYTEGEMRKGKSANYEKHPYFKEILDFHKTDVDRE